MDFKSLCVLIAFIALGAGIFQGWSEYQFEKKARDEQADLGGDLDGDKTALVSRTRKTGGRKTRPPEKTTDGSRAPRSTVDNPKPVVDDPELDPSLSLDVSEDDEVKLAALEKLLVRHDFKQASEDARALAEETQGMARARAQQVEGKARVFEALLPPSTEKIPEFQEVVDANRTVFIVRRLEDRFDHYRMVLLSGVITDMKKEDVIEIRQADSKGIRKTLAVKLLKQVKKYDEPINLYLRGVRKFYRVGLRKEGLGLMDRLLAMRDGDLVLAVLGEEQSEVLFPYWNLARGSAISTLRRKFERAKLAMVSRVGVPGGTPPASAVGDGGVSSGTSDRGNGGTSGIDLGPAEAVPTGPLDETAFAEVLAQVRRADEIYLKAMPSKDGKNIKRAFILFSASQEALYRMPDDDRVRSLRRKVTQRIFDAYKALPFDAQ